MNKPAWLLLPAFFTLLFLLTQSPGSVPSSLEELLFKNTRPVLALITRTPVCLERDTIPAEEYHWLHLPNSPAELATDEYYGFLSGQLIKAGVVDASECPLNGLWSNGYANSCGLEKAHEATLYLQNVFDDEILAAGTQYGVPPVMLKQLLRFESQFWPNRVDLIHYGMGHVTKLGAENALMWSPELYDSLCRAVNHSPCSTPYFQSSREMNNLLAWQLLNVMDTNCPTCQYKIDVQKAEQSIAYIAQILLGYCKQTSQIVYNATATYSNISVDYATIWKLTLMNYNAGPNCVYNAIQASFDGKTSKKLDWNVIADHASTRACEAGVDYVENITQKYYNFTAETP
jgi:hypothetical protein